MMRPSDYLKRGWCRVHKAVDVDGVRVDPTSPDAVQWCMLGSLSAAYPAGVTDWWDLYDHICQRFVSGGFVSTFNDAAGRTQQECIDAMMAAEKEVFDAP